MKIQDLLFKIARTMALCLGAVIGQAYCDGIDEVPFSHFLAKWEDAKNGQYDHAEDSTSGRTLLVFEIGRTMNPQAVPLLEKILLEDHYACVRAEAAKSLERIGAVSSIPALKKSLKTDGNYEVCLYSARALYKLKDFSKDANDKIFSIARGENRGRWRAKGFTNKEEEETDTTLPEKYKNYLQAEALKCLEMIPSGEAEEILIAQEGSPNLTIAEIAKTTKSKWLAKNKSVK